MVEQLIFSVAPLKRPPAFVIPVLFRGERRRSHRFAEFRGKFYHRGLETLEAESFLKQHRRKRFRRTSRSAVFETPAIPSVSEETLPTWLRRNSIADDVC